MNLWGEQMRKSTSNSNYMDKDKIVFHYNQSVGYFNAYCKRDSDDESYETKSLINQAGTLLYQCFEAALKRHLVLLFKEGYDAGRIKWRDYENQKKSIEGMSRPQLIQLLNAQDPKHMQFTAVDFNLIDTNARRLTNAHKHELSNSSHIAYREVLPEIRKFILAYVNPNAQLDLDASQEYIFSLAASSLFKVTDDFNENGRWSYVLVCDAFSELTEEQKMAIAYIKWSMVLDFDINSEDNGFASAFFNDRKLQPLKFDLSRPEHTVFNKFTPTPYWFFLNGLADTPSTLVDELDIRKWGQKYGSKLNSAFQKYHMVFDKPIKVVILSSSIRKVKKLIEALDQVYEENVQFLILSSPASYADTDEQCVMKQIPLSATEFANSILANLSLFRNTTQTYSCMMPAKNGTLVSVVPGHYNHFELVHKDIAESDETNEDKKSPELFYQGRLALSWYGAKHGFAIARNEVATRIKRLINGMEDSYGVFDIVHDPGIGGSTFSKNFAYNIRLEYPVCILKEYIKETTAKQLNNLYIALRATIIVFIDSNILNQEQVKSLANELKPLAFQFIIIYTRRRKNSEPRNILMSNLNDYECIEMKNKLERYGSPEVLVTLDEICKSPVRKSERSPFFMSLYTFEENFVGIKPYIRAFLDNINDEQKNILVYLSIADKYANRPISEAFFIKPLIAEHDDDDENVLFKNDVAFRELLVLTLHDNFRVYKIRHPLFAETIIEQTLYEDVSGNEFHQAIKANNLIRYLIDFIKSSKTNSVVDYDTTLDVMRNLFIMKDSDDIIQNRFSPLITRIVDMLPRAIDAENAAGIIFKTLVDTYPDEAHFLAHLARFYTYVEKNYPEGIRLAQEAILVSESFGEHDPLLYHICGMNIKMQIKEDYKGKIRDAHNNGETIEEKKWKDHIESAATEALQMFSTTRSLNNQIPGYISAVDLCIDIVDIGRGISENDDFISFVQQNKGSWYMKYLDEALSLMEALRSAEDSDELTNNTLQTKINEIIGSLDKTVSMWEKYLQQAKSEEVSQVRRFLARAKQSKIQKLGYSKASAKEIDDIIMLMEENIKDDPSNSANIRIWFDAVRYCTSKDPELLLDEAINNLSVWKATTGSVEAYYYYFILTCIKAVEGISRAEADIPFLQSELKAKSAQRFDNRHIYEWLGEGKGLERLRRSTDYQKTDKPSINLERLIGRVEAYKNPGSAIIRSHNMEVFFNPSRAKRRMDSEDVGKRVTFCLGFSYDGLRAYDQSVDEVGIDDEEQKIINPNSLCVGLRVKCRVTRNIDFYTQVKLMDYRNQDGSIHITQLANGYNSENRPKEGTMIFATIQQQPEAGARRQKFWKLTMRDVAQENDDNMPEWKRKLNALKFE
jgi:hypothetical protein